jgi:hypothetical protein
MIQQAIGPNSKHSEQLPNFELARLLVRLDLL